MITTEIIKELAVKYQTSQLNCEREYFQHLFISYFYQLPAATNIYFKGGTALRLIYGSPRFSEDLDFSADKISIKNLETAILSTLEQIQKEKVKVTLNEAKTTSGGYLGSVAFEAWGFHPVEILLEFSLRRTEQPRRKKTQKKIITIFSEFTLAYTLVGLSQEELIEEKIQALLYRQKPRDFYDLYFILRSNLLPPTKKALLANILKILKKKNINFEKELKVFLPKSHWLIIRNFNSALETEIVKIFT